MQSLRFKNKTVFGATFDAYYLKAQGNVMTILLNGFINIDGTIDIKHIDKITLSELWSYIYILYHNNKTYDIFDDMRGRRGHLMSKGTAKRFVKVVLKFTGTRAISKEVLIQFINQVIKTRSPNNPILRLTKPDDPKSNPDKSKSKLDYIDNPKSKLDDQRDDLERNLRKAEKRIEILKGKIREYESSGRMNPFVFQKMKQENTLMREKLEKLTLCPSKVVVLKERLAKSTEIIQQLLAVSKEPSIEQALKKLSNLPAYIDRIKYLDDENKDYKTLVNFLNNELELPATNQNINQLMNAIRRRLPKINNKLMNSTKKSRILKSQ